MSKKCRTIGQTSFSYFLLSLSIALFLTVTISQQKSWAPVSVNVVDPAGNRIIIDPKIDKITPVSWNTWVNVEGWIEIIIRPGISNTFKLECRDSRTKAAVTCPTNYEIQPSDSK